MDTVADAVEPEAMSFEEKDLIRQALRKLPRVQREALVMFEILQMKIKEIAVHQKVTQSAVKSRLVRGREKLSQEYKALSNEEIYDGTAVKQSA